MPNLTEIREFLQWSNCNILGEELTPQVTAELQKTFAFAAFRLQKQWIKFKDEICKQEPFKTILKWFRYLMMQKEALIMPKLKKLIVVSNKCRECALFGQCTGRVLPPDEFCLGYKKRTSPPSESVQKHIEKTTLPRTIFKSRANNGSICDNCVYELDGMCRDTWSVGLKKVAECKNFNVDKERVMHGTT